MSALIAGPLLLIAIGLITGWGCVRRGWEGGMDREGFGCTFCVAGRGGGVKEVWGSGKGLRVWVCLLCRGGRVVREVQGSGEGLRDWVGVPLA